MRIKKCKLVMIGLVTPLLFLSHYILADTHQDVEKLTNEVKILKKRLNNLENKKSNSNTSDAQINDIEVTLDEVSEILGNRAVVHAFDGIKLDVGGFLHSAYTYVDGEEDSVGSFNRQNFEILIGAELAENWSAFIAGGFLREANDPFVVGDRNNPAFDTNNRNPLIIGWVNYQKSDAFNIRVGRMITPHGIINIEHFPATLLDPEQPQLLRPFGGNTIFPNFSTGIQVHGKKFLKAGIISYATYVTNATGPGVIENSEEITGGRLSFGASSGSWELGLNFSDSYRASTASDNRMTGVDLHLRLGGFELASESYSTNEDFGGDRTGYYVQPALHLNHKWTAFYRFDVLEAGDAYGKSTENALGLSYKVSSNVHLRAIFTAKEFEGGFTDSSLLTPLENSEANILQLSGTFSF